MSGQDFRGNGAIESHRLIFVSASYPFRFTERYAYGARGPFVSTHNLEARPFDMDTLGVAASLDSLVIRSPIFELQQEEPASDHPLEISTYLGSLVISNTVVTEEDYDSENSYSIAASLSGLAITSVVVENTAEVNSVQPSPTLIDLYVGAPL